MKISQNDKSYRDGAHSTAIATPCPVSAVPAPKLAQTFAPTPAVVPAPAPAIAPTRTPALASGTERVAATVAKIGLMTQHLQSKRTPATVSVAAQSVATPAPLAVQKTTGHGTGRRRRNMTGAQTRVVSKPGKPKMASGGPAHPAETHRAQAPPHAQEGVNLSIFRSSAFKKRALSTSQGSTTRWGGTRKW